MPSTTPVHADLARDVRLAAMALTRRVKDSTTSIAPHLFTVLAHLEHGPATAADLAGRERVSAPTMSRTLCELEERGLVAREVDPSDARAKIVTITRAGRRAIDEGRAERDHWMADRLAELTDDEVRLLRDAAQVLRRVVEQS